MNEEDIKQHNYSDELVRIIRSNISDRELLEKLSDYHENDIAGAFEQLEVSERKRLYPILGAEKVSEIFEYIEDVGEYIKELNIKKAAKVLENMDSDDAVDVLEGIDDNTSERILKLMDDESSRDIQLIQSYDDDEIGSVMTTNFILIHNELSIRAAMRELILQAGKNDNISTVYVCDQKDRFYGAIDLKDLIIAREHDKLEDLISTSYPYFVDHDSISENLDRIREYAEDSLPVLDKEHHLIGIITAQDLIEVVDDEMGDDYAKLAGLISEEDLREKTLQSMKKRLPWLLALLLLGVGVSTVVGAFESVVAALPLVMCFQSLILDMAGNVGTQSLAVTIRVLMDENLKPSQLAFLIFKEVKVGLFNGLVLGSLAFALIGAYICLIKNNTVQNAFSISACVGIALAVAMIISSLVGTIVPMFFHHIKIDPAVASGPLITTVNDLVAVVTYYGLSWFLLIYVLKMV